MGIATVNELKSFLTDKVQGVSDETLQMYLADAEGSVFSGGVSVSHKRFAELQRYYAAHLLDSAGILQNQVTSESADGISRSFDTVFIPGAHESYLDLYKSKRHEVVGFQGRVC